MAHDQFPNYPPTYGIPPRSPLWATLCLKARVFVSRVYTKMYENDRISRCDVSWTLCACLKHTRLRYLRSSFSTAQTNTICLRFCLDPSSTAFSHRCVFDEKAQSISVDRRPKNIIMESLSFTYTTNVRFKLRISGNRKSADKNDSKQFLWIKKLMKLQFMCTIMNSKTTSKGETWSRGTNSRLPFDVNAKLNFSSVCFFKRNVCTGPK